MERESEAALLATYRAMPGSASGPITFRSWTPVGVRTRRQRRFTALIVDGRPSLVLKAPLDLDDAKVVGEWHTLKGLSLPARIHHSRAIARAGAGFMMTFVSGYDLPDILIAPDHHQHFADVLGRTVELVAAMHRHGAVSDGNSRARWDAARQYVDRPYVAERRFRIALEGAMMGPTHGDLAPWNLRHDVVENRTTLIDWEDYRAVGIPALDIVNLLVTLGLPVFAGFRAKGWDWFYDQLLESDHWYALLLREELQHYARLTDQPARLVIDLLPFFCQWLIARIEGEGRDASSLYYGCVARRYIARPPGWVEALPNG